MSDRRDTKQGTRQFTMDELREEQSRVVTAAKKDGGCVVVDKEGQQLFSLWIPQEPIGEA
jgi:hypothetical protein